MRKPVITTQSMVRTVIVKLPSKKFMGLRLDHRKFGKMDSWECEFMPHSILYIRRSQSGLIWVVGIDMNHAGVIGTGKTERKAKNSFMKSCTNVAEHIEHLIATNARKRLRGR
jgi:hypothetical protein